jgi:hypothetical protein
MIWHNIKISLVSLSQQKSDLNNEVTYIFVLWVIYRLEDPMEDYICTSCIKRSIMQAYFIPSLKHHFHDLAQCQNKPGIP